MKYSTRGGTIGNLSRITNYKRTYSQFIFSFVYLYELTALLDAELVFFFTIAMNDLLNFLNPLSANITKWSNTLKQFVGNLPTNCLSVFDHFVVLALKGLMMVLQGNQQSQSNLIKKINGTYDTCLFRINSPLFYLFFYFLFLFI